MKLDPDETGDDERDDDIPEFDDDVIIITSSNTAVVQLYNKILDLQSNPSVTFENLGDEVSSVAKLHKYLAGADKQDKKEFKELFHDYKEMVKKLVKHDKSQKKIIEHKLKSVEKDFKKQEKKDKKKEKSEKKEHKEHKDKKEKDD